MTSRWRRGAALALFIAGPLSIAAVPVLRRGTAYPFVASSRVPGYERGGMLGRGGAYGVLFHTAQQQDPWIEIDLGEMREIHAVDVENRLDCCGDRAVPLVLELAGDDRAFREADRLDGPFQRATLRPAGSPQARYVRLRVEALTMFHLSEVWVR